MTDIVVDSGPLIALFDGSDVVASVDSDFTVYRTASRQVFRNLFFDE